jgi:WXG100 family type VII secretion target
MSIFQYVVGEVDDVANSLMQQANQCEDMSSTVRNQAEGLVGGVWTGADADAFLQEVVTRFIPEVAELVAAIGGFSISLGSAVQIVTVMDDDVIGKANQLYDTFSQVYRG